MEENFEKVDEAPADAAPAGVPNPSACDSRGRQMEENFEKVDEAPADAAPAGVPNPSACDSRGRQFDPKVHAVMPDGTPHKDSSGAFIPKDLHYNAPAKAHFPDTYRQG